MPQTIVQITTILFPLIVGLFLGRALGEYFILPFFIIIAIIIFVAGLLWQLNRWRPFLGWTTLILLLYLFYPVPNPTMALWIGFWWLFTFPLQTTVTLTLWDYFWPFLLTVTTFGLYFITLSPDLLTADNGEFQLVAVNLGLAHPPGFPLYTILAHMMTWLPIPAMNAYKITFFSAITSTLTVRIIYAAIRKLTQQRLAAFVTAVALATSTTFWAQATTANIRSLTGLFTAVAFYTLIRFYQQRTQQPTNVPPPEMPNTVQPAGSRAATPQLKSDKRSVQNLIIRGDHPIFTHTLLPLFTLTLSLGVTHHISLAFMAIVMALFVLWMDPALLVTPRRWPLLLLAAALGFLPLLYLPWRDPNLQNFEAFLEYALGLGFQGDFFYFNTAALIWQRLGVVFNILTFQFNSLLLMGMGGGFLLLLRQQPRLAFLLGGTFAIHTFVVATYRAPQAVEYMLPAYIPLVLCLGYAVGYTADLFFQAPTLPIRTAALIAVTLIITAVLYQAAERYPSYKTIRAAYDTRNYAQTILQEAPRNSIVLANWHWVTPLWYLKRVERMRPDVEVLYLFPRTADYNGEWVSLVQQELTHNRPVITTYYEENSYAVLPPHYPLGEAFLFTNTPLESLPDNFTPTTLALGDQLEVVGYQLNGSEVDVANPLTVTIAWRPLGENLSPTNLFLHLVGFEGQLYAQQDIALRPQAAGLSLTQFKLTPRLGAQPGDFALMLGAYGADGTPLLSSTEQPREHIATVTVQPMSNPPYTSHPTYRPLTEGSGRTLIGYDFDHTLPNQTRLYLHWQTAEGYWSQTVDLLPDEPFTLPPSRGLFGLPNSQFTLYNAQSTSYIPLGQGLVWTGSTPALNSFYNLAPQEEITISQTFHATRPVFRDIGISVRLLGFTDDGVTWAWRTPDTADNDIPALGGIPTLKWIAGSTVHHPRTLTIDAAAYSGQVMGGLVRPYDVFTNRPLAILDERLTDERPWIPLAPVTLP